MINLFKKTKSFGGRLRFAFMPSLFISFLLFTSISLTAQTNAPSIQSGVTFQWSDTQTNQSNSATIKSITINGSVYDDFKAPSGYALTQLGQNGHNPNGIRFNGTNIETTSSSATWAASALSAFQDRNLNHYFQASSNGVNICDNYTAENTTLSQRQTLTFANTITSTGSILAVTERNANNCIHIEIFGIPANGTSEVSLGETFINPDTTRWGFGGTSANPGLGTPGAFNPPSANSDYWLTDRVVDNRGTIGLALFNLESFVPIGSEISRIQYTAASSDHFDGKVFVLNNSSVNNNGDNINDADDDDDGILDINERICNSVSAKSASAIVANNNVINANNILTPSSASAEFNAIGDNLIIDLGSFIPVGTTLKFQISATSTSSKAITIEQSNSDGSSTSNLAAVTKTSTPSQNIDYILTKDTRYIQLKMTAVSNGILAISYLEVQDHLICTDIDTDGDLIPDYKDTDSDGDGCPDAIEANGGITLSQLDASGAIDVSINGTDVNGVPNDANGGQTDVSSINSNIISLQCDTDGDGIPANIDLDDDNDGILDTIENENCIVGTPSNSGTWTASGSGSARTWATTAGLINVVASATNYGAGTGFALNDFLTNDVMSCSGAYSEPTIINNPSLSIRHTFHPDGNINGTPSTGEITFDFGVDVINPVLHFDRLGGGGGDGKTTSSLISVLTSGITLTELQQNDIHFDTTSSSITRTSGISYNSTPSECGPPLAGTAAGSVRLNGIFRTVTIKVSMNPNQNALVNDRWEIAFSDVVQAPDCDNDGIANKFDLDSDNDGITDVIEAGGTDANQDGIADGAVGTTPTTNGVPSSAGTGLTPLNSDTDSIPDFLDIDADNDGIPDNIEAQTSAGYIQPSGVGTNITDTNENGVDDVYENTSSNTVGFVPENTDGDNKPDYLDADSDNDGVLDIVENGDTDNTLAGTDIDGDGLDDNFDDNNDASINGSTVNDGLGNGDKVTNATNLETAYGDEDTDFPETGDVDYRDILDNDNDGIPDSIDLDDDNDGIADTDEGCENLITNGDFENQDFSDASIFPGGFTSPGGTFIGTTYNTNTLEGWNYTQNLDGWVGGKSPSWDPTVIYADAYKGNQYLDALGNNDVTGGVSNILSQTVTTIVGKSYTLSFFWGEDVGHETNQDVTLNVAILDASNTAIINQTLVATSEGKIGGIIGPKKWYVFSQEFVATTTQTTLQFQATPPSTGSLGAGAALDFVSISTCADTDNDGIPNSFDLDSDNDGIPDLVEAGGTDTDGNGLIDNINPDGTLTNDTDNDGLDDRYDSDNGGTDLSNIDTDGDGIPNSQDLDADNDGIPDVIEAGGVDENGDGKADNFIDTDNDGFNDVVDGDVGQDGTSENTTNALITTGPDADNDGAPDSYPNGDTDNDGIPNHLDLDADNDGIADVVEAGGTDVNGDGKADNFVDADNDGFNDVVDGDPTNALANGTDTAGTNTNNALIISGPDGDNDGKPDSYPNGDTDNDGILNHLDLDADNDGIADVVEAGGTDVNGDGKADNFVDADNDGFNDVVDGDPTNALANGTDTAGTNTNNALIISGPDGDNDGKPDSYPNGDTDNDGILNHLDLDADNDGIADVVEAGGTDVNGDGKADNFVDADNDGFNDVVDGDPTNALANGTDTAGTNTNNALIVTGEDTDNDGKPNSYPNGDTDNDGIPNHLDLDADNDGIADVVEAGGTDVNGDGKADNFVDADNDGFNDVVDGDPTNALANGTDTAGTNTNNALIITGADTNGDGNPNSYPTGDTDNDGILNHLDLDADNDGIADVVEAGGTDVNGDGKADNFVDADNDGFNDVVDGDPTNALANGTDTAGTNTSNVLIVTGADTSNDGKPNSYPNGDTDNDGILDNLDLDADNDGIADVVEAGGTDVNGDGKADNFVDADNDGFNDVVDGDPTNALANGTDTAGTNTANVLIVTGADTNNDGKPNSIPTNDTDGDGIRDYLDLDSDNDGIVDVIEAGGNDTNRDGLEDNFVDADNDGFNDAVDGDPTNALANGTDTAGSNTSNVLIATGADTNNDGKPNSYPNANLDGDDKLNHVDIDADNDGIPDNIEGQTSIGYTAPSGVGVGITDANMNGVDDVYETATTIGLDPENTDGTDNPDYLDLDSDNDGILDIAENGDTDNTLAGTDQDNDGLDDNFDDNNDASIAGSTVNDGLGNGDKVTNITNLETAYGDEDANFNPGIGDLDYRDTSENGVPMITQVYQFGAERWIEITNIQGVNSIPANVIKIQLYKDKTGEQVNVTPDVTYTVTSALAPGQSVIFKNTGNVITNINSSAINITNNALTDIAGANDIITLSTTNDATSYANRYDVVEAFDDNTSYVRIDETLIPNETYTENEWVVFIDDALRPEEFLITAAERHPHDPLISEIVGSSEEANTLLGLHRIEKTVRTGNIWNNGFPDRSRYVVVNEKYEHKDERLSARKLEVQGSNILSLDSQLLVVTNNINIADNAEIRLLGNSQFVQTHTGVSDVTGNGKLYVEQNTGLANIYRYNYMSSPVTTLGAQTYSVESVLKDGTNAVSHNGVVGQGALNIARNINFVGGFDGSTGTPINIADYWIYTFASSNGNRSSWAQKFKSGTMKSTDGFIFKGPEVDQNYTFVGNPNDGAQTTNVGGNDSYLLGNPFPSALNGLKFIKDNLGSIDGSLYFWDHVGEEDDSSTASSGHNYAGYIGGYATLNLSMAVPGLKPSVGAFNITLEAENATTNGLLLVDSAVNFITLNNNISFIQFNAITRATDVININYKSVTGKSLILKVDNKVINTYNLPASPNTSTFTINECLTVGSIIRFESLDTNPIAVDNIVMNDDDGDITCAPSSGTDASLYKTPGTFIPVGQGFFIGGDVDGGPIVFNNSQRQYVTEGTTSSVFFKTSKKTKDGIVENDDFNRLPLLKLGMDFVSEEGKSLHRQIGVSFSPNNSSGFDKGYDSEINDLGTTDIYWKFSNNDSKYVIAGVENVSTSLEIPFEITMNYKGTIVLKIDDLNRITENMFVKDKLENRTYSITDNQVALQLNKGEHKDRFAIVFKEGKVLATDDVNNPVLENQISIFLDKESNELVINNRNSLNIESVTLFNILGQKAKSWNTIASKIENRLKVTNLSDAVYIVNIKTEKGIISKKIFYKK
ncbi:T9SS type A sorting domain-containing protein [Polaribacter sp. PL03]|uniref:T9SS type A sorting domain-containing protein n=1 Tax=Polaribacter sp. PL03 TaxID=3088353 RepID=UPI0029CDB151|nr:T9SS type A sorting domain-containing protein [Polaribacter sp. PL03]MDX6747470.1 T9SS type A sorting domain-containing protein [Polaribacter sp. PL03]